MGSSLLLLVLLLPLAGTLFGIAVLILLPLDNVKLVWSEVWWPPSISQDAVENIFTQLLADLRSYKVVFEIRSNNAKLRFLVAAQEEHLRYVQKLITALVPGTEAEIIDIPRRSPLEQAARLIVRNRFKQLTHKNSKVVSSGIITAMSMASKDEELALQVVLGRRVVPYLDSTGPKAIQNARAESRVYCTIRVGVKTATPYRRRVLLDRLKSSLRVAQGPYGLIWFASVKPSDLQTARAPELRSPLLGVAQLAGLVGWPLGQDVLPGTGRNESRVLRGPKQLREGGRILAHSTSYEDRRPLNLSEKDGLHHLHVMGPTGVGKSTLLLNLIIQDMKNNKGVIVVDPKGDLVADVLARIPDHRQDDVAVFNPTDREPIGLNPLDSDGREPEVVADNLIGIFHRLYKDSWGPRTEDILYSSLLTLLATNQVSLVTLPYLLTNRELRASILNSVSDPIALGPFWQWYDSLSEAQRHYVIAPVMNKLRAFLLRPHMRAVIGQVRPRLNMRDVFKDQKILLVSLAKGSMGYETSSLLGSLVLGEIWQTALERFSSADVYRKPIGLYLDEFQDYLNLPTDLVDLLSKARAGGVAITLAHQHFSQLTPEVRDAVLTNARSQVYFQLSHSDATVVSSMSQGVLAPRDFQLLKRYEVYLNLLIKGRASGFMSGKTFPAPPTTSDPDWIAAVSRDEYGASAEEVDEMIAETAHAYADPVIVVGRRRRLY